MVHLRGSLSVPGDKSITHRAVLFGALAEGVSAIRTSALGRDNLGTMRIMRQLGVAVSGSVQRRLLAMVHEEGLKDFEDSNSELCTIRVRGVGLHGLTASATPLDCGNSGTTARLLSGILAGQRFASTLIGDASLSKRPFKRVVDPLTEMGARFNGATLPLTIEGGALRGIDYRSPHASAQVKSAIMLAGLYTNQPVTVTEPRLSRDHSERMLTAMGCEVSQQELSDGSWRISLPATRSPLRPLDIDIPGDFSAAAFFLVAGSVFPGSRVVVEGVGYNTTRIGLLTILERMGAKISLQNRRQQGGEDVVDFVIETAELQGVDLDEQDVVLAIDEIPVFAIAAAAARGRTTVRGARELRVKESDRIAMTVAILRSFGVDVEEFEDGFAVNGDPTLGRELRDPGVTGKEPWRVCGDHRISMTGALLELLVTGKMRLDDVAAVETSFPTFLRCLEGIVAN